MNRWTLVSGTSLGLPFIPLLAGADPVYAAASALLAAGSLVASVKYRWVSAILYLLSAAAAVLPLVNLELMKLVAW
ncbi:MAG: hypothetical protein QXF69_07330 [Thermofilaceae archaeon]